METLRYTRNLPEEEFMAIMDVLNAFDRHKVGKISIFHLPLVMQSLSKKLNKTQLFLLKYLVDVEHKSNITFSEVFKVLAKWDAWMLEKKEDTQKTEKSTEFTEAVETFKKLDENGKGTMKSTELPSLLQSAGKEVTSTELKYLIHCIKDEDDYEEDGEHDGEDGEDGVFGFSEFFQVLSILDRDPRPGRHLEDEEIRVLFRNVDVDGTGFIAKYKLDRIAQTLAPNYWGNKGWYPLDLLDVNENGQIDYEEFIPIIKLVDNISQFKTRQFL